MFINGLARDFGIDDPAALAAMVARAEQAYRDADTHQEAGSLNGLYYELICAQIHLRDALRLICVLSQVTGPGRAGDPVVTAARQAEFEVMIDHLRHLSGMVFLALDGNPSRRPPNRPPDYHLYALVNVVARYCKEEWAGGSQTPSGWRGGPRARRQGSAGRWSNTSHPVRATS
jgi:hypothetical protein